ncbi:hypothetical protein DFH07DRAFT_775170 [Mycena maculata]|uniref:Uncharacterized protein n=1 Tax=Mycena maculata TaxID=230809 RepID=A0AAD7N9M8_9AGAR|nr:hypothetical protein DFH07DRAFT_775170 [Mycena maculata]
MDAIVRRLPLRQANYIWSSIGLTEENLLTLTPATLLRPGMSRIRDATRRDSTFFQRSNGTMRFCLRPGPSSNVRERETQKLCEVTMLVMIVSEPDSHRTCAIEAAADLTKYAVSQGFPGFPRVSQGFPCVVRVKLQQRTAIGHDPHAVVVLVLVWICHQLRYNYSVAPAYSDLSDFVPMDITAAPNSLQTFGTSERNPFSFVGLVEALAVVSNSSPTSIHHTGRYSVGNAICNITAYCAFPEDQLSKVKVANLADHSLGKMLYGATEILEHQYAQKLKKGDGQPRSTCKLLVKLKYGM